jgi:OOP family OmpA-OmpF porin
MRRMVRLAVMLSICIAGSARAAEPAAEYSSEEFVKAILSGPQPCPKGRTAEACEANPKTRRFSLASPAPTPAAAPRPARLASAPHPVAPRRQGKLSSADVLVTFALGSAEITPQGQANLHSIAQGLNTAALAAVSFEVAGFTDVTGSMESNKLLSQRRAEAVKAYLVSLNVPPTRLNTAGYGADHLIDPADPASEANRRVELHRLN